MKKRFISLFVIIMMVITPICTNALADESTVVQENSKVSTASKKELMRYILFSMQESSKEDKDATEVLLDTLMKIAGDSDEEYNKILRTLTESIDEYGEYYTDEEVALLNADLTGVSGGIGATVEMRNGIFSIVTVLPNSPCEKAGVMAGWRILEVNGVSMAGESLYGALSYVRGEINTDVTIKFLDLNKKEVTLKLVRDKIEVTSLSYQILKNTKNKIGYIEISNFATTTGTELKTALESFKKEKIDKIILDLRYNGGGVLDGALEVASAFLPKGKIITTIEPKDTTKKEVYKSTGSIYDGELLLLVNQYSASASEVVTGALIDNNRAKTVGVKTFGKGTVQTMMPLPLYGGIFKFTTAHYLTPNGTDINKVGIQPTYKVPIEEFQLHPAEIPQLDLKRKFNIGDSGKDVAVVKDFLTQLRYKVTDGDVYDEQTFNEVALFQEQHSLYSYGICDFATQEEIRKVLLETTFYKDTQIDKAIEIMDSKS